jgi:hypothetical protein
MCFEMELGRETLTALGADNGANLQVNSPDVPLYQTRTRLEATLMPTCVVPNTLGLSAGNPLDVIVGVDGCGGTGGGRLRRFILGGEGGGGRSLRRRWRASSGVGVAREVAGVTGVGR